MKHGSLTLPRRLVLQLLAQAQGSAGEQTGGLLLKDAEHGITARTLPNVAARADRLYIPDPVARMSYTSQMQPAGPTVLALYHSTADKGYQEPDAVELQRLEVGDGLLILISLGTQGVLQLQGWGLDGAAVYPVEVRIAD